MKITQVSAECTVKQFINRGTAENLSFLGWDYKVNLEPVEFEWPLRHLRGDMPRTGAQRNDLG